MSVELCHKQKFLSWKRLLQPLRFPLQQTAPVGEAKLTSKPFETDFQRIILSASFRRLQDKTQVFPLDKSDFVRTRLTHSLETASFAKTISQLTFNKLRADTCKTPLPAGLELPDTTEIAIIENILLSAGLLHDIGNPPFGHYGETTIRSWFKNNLARLQYRQKSLTHWLNQQMQQDFYNFEGNAQALRLLTKLHFLDDNSGMHLTYPLLHCLIKYPVNSLNIENRTTDVAHGDNSVAHSSGNIARHKLGYFYAEKAIFHELSLTLGTALSGDIAPSAGNSEQLSYTYPITLGETACRHPLSFLLEACDDIAYRTADIEDALRKNKLNYFTLLAHITQAAAVHPELASDAADLNNFYNLARKRGYVETELYAVQNWLMQAQNRLLQDLAASFCENYCAIMQGNCTSPLAAGRYSGYLLDLLGEIAYRYVFTSKDIVTLEVACDTVINSLLDLFIPACINYGQESADNQPVYERLMRLVSKNYAQSYHLQSADKSPEEQLYLRLLLITDYICGMTDNYARDLYQQLKGISVV